LQSVIQQLQQRAVKPQVVVHPHSFVGPDAVFVPPVTTLHNAENVGQPCLVSAHKQESNQTFDQKEHVRRPGRASEAPRRPSGPLPPPRETRKYSDLVRERLYANPQISLDIAEDVIDAVLAVLSSYRLWH